MAEPSLTAIPCTPKTNTKGTLPPDDACTCAKLRGRAGGKVQFNTIVHSGELMEHITTVQSDFVSTSRPDFSVLRPAADEELANAITHGLGLAAAIVGSMVMMTGVSVHANAYLSMGCAAYLFTLVAVYAMSTISHTVTTPRWRMLFRQLDQAFIFLLIVGTYTPYSIAHLHGLGWTTLLTIMWMVALGGFAAKAFFAHKIENGSILPYLMLGWMSIIALPSIWHLAPQGEFAMIIAGGVCYTIGTFFLLNDTRVRHFHAAWHIWVIAGSACHFYGLMKFVVDV
jgi:hemolysin III